MRDPTDVEVPLLTDGVVELCLRSLAREHLEAAWFMTSPDNLASARTAELVGAEYVDTREVPEHSDIRALGIRWVRHYRLVP